MGKLSAKRSSNLPLIAVGHWQRLGSRPSCVMASVVHLAEPHHADVACGFDRNGSPCAGVIKAHGIYSLPFLWPPFGSWTEEHAMEG